MKIKIDPVFDQAILTVLREGQPRRAARILVRNYGRAVFKICWAMVEDIDQAEDLTQASFQRALLSLSKLRGYDSTLEWLETTTRECCEEYCRERGLDLRRTPEGEELEEPQGISESLQRRLDVLASCL